MMVKETRHIFDLSDIKAVRLQCKNCGREAVQSIKATEVPKICPFCREEWEVDLPQGSRSMNFLLIYYMKELLKSETERMVIRFEIDGEE